MPRKAKNTSWINIIKGPLIEDIETYKQRFGKNPTLRGSYYRLYSKGYFENDRSAYSDFVDAVTYARWRSVIHDENNGHLDLDLMPEGYFTPYHKKQLKQIMNPKGARLDFDCFTDDTRSIHTNFPTYYRTAAEYNDVGINYLINAPENYAVKSIPRWLYQPNYVEIWTEKYTMLDVLNNILLNKDDDGTTNDLQIQVVPDRGFASTDVFRKADLRFARQHRYEAYYEKRIQGFRRGKTIHILYFGDFDPSGDNMGIDIPARLARLGWGSNKKGEGNLKFHIIAITKEIVHRYGLPYDPDKLTRSKLLGDSRKAGDSRTPKFMEKNDGILYAVEIDALAAIHYDELAAMVLKEVDSLFDQNIYNEHVLPLMQAGPKEASKDLKRRIMFLDKNTDMSGSDGDE